VLLATSYPEPYQDRARAGDPFHNPHPSQLLGVTHCQAKEEDTLGPFALISNRQFLSFVLKNGKL